MKTKLTPPTSNPHQLTAAPRLSRKRRELLERYFSNALVLAALLKMAQHQLGR